jgi:glycerophosphoryl diester phosphodiesterase
MIDTGVDGTISDHPDVLRKVAGDKGVELPVGSLVTR